MNTIVRLLVLTGVGMGAASLLADSTAGTSAVSVSKQATVGIQYNPSAASTTPSASPVAAAPAAPTDNITSLPAYNVNEQDKTKAKVDHDVAVTEWLEKPAVIKKPLNKSVTVALLSPPKEGANGKVEEPIVDLDW